jgi:hypothetical protein
MKVVIEIPWINDIFGSVMLAVICHIWQSYLDWDLSNRVIRNHAAKGYIQNVMAKVTVV